MLLKHIFNIIADNAATGASPLYLAQIDAVLFGHPTGQWGRFDRSPLDALGGDRVIALNARLSLRCTFSRNRSRHLTRLACH